MFGASRGSTTMTTVAFQQEQNKRRQAEYAQADLTKYHRQNEIIGAANISHDRIDTVRRAKRFQQQNSEMQRAYEIEKAQKEAEERAILRQQEEQLSKAMQEIKDQEYSTLMETRRICAQSEEIKNLKAALASARLHKEQHTQMAEAALLKVQNRVDQSDELRRMEEVRQRQADEEQKAYERALEQKEATRRQLQGQMHERDAARRQHEQEIVKEREQVDAVVAKLRAADQQKVEDQKRKVTQAQREIRDYLEQRQVWRLQEVTSVACNYLICYFMDACVMSIVLQFEMCCGK
mgnify:CR=1 FL=1